jgi:hypothetical protein
MTDLAEIEAAIRKASEQIASLEQNRIPPEQLHVTVTPASVRAVVTKALVVTFIVYLVLIAGFIVYGGEADRVGMLVEIGKTLFLPTFAFVIGHYFGSKAD